MLDGAALLNQSIHNIDTSEIRKMFDLAAKIERPLNLSIGQPDFPVPEPVREAMIKAVRDNLNSYTPTAGILPLRQAIAEKWRTHNGFTVEPENIIVSTGVASILFLLFQAIIDPGDDILLVDPYFLIYPALLKYQQANLHTIPENFTAADIDHLLASGVKYKAIIFSTPSNPTGKIFEREQLAQLVRLAQSTGAVLVSDEIYEVFDYENKFVSTASLYPEGTLTLNGFSKSHAMTGIRVGYLGAPANLAPIVQKMATLQQYSVVCAPQPGQWAAITALQTPVVEEMKLMRRRRDLVAGLLKGVARYPSPDGAFYIFPEVPIESRQFAEAAIAERLLIVPGYIFSAHSRNVRISYAQKEEILEEGVQIFRRLVERFRG